MSTEKEQAFIRVTEALDAYLKLCPKEPDPAMMEPPVIVPKLRHADPNCFRSGMNMFLDAGGNMPGKIPVVVVPARPVDLRRYQRRRTVGKLLADLKLT